MKRSWPPEFYEIPRIDKRGHGNEPIHKIFVSEEFLKARLLPPIVRPYVEGTPVVDVVNKAVVDTINCAKKVNCSWRWKIMNLLPRNMVDSKDFIKNCELNGEHFARLSEVIYHDIFPVEHFGSSNAKILIKLIGDHLRGCTIAGHPVLKSLDISYLRAMRCQEFKSNLREAGLSTSIESIYKMGCTAFAELAHEVVCCIALMFIERIDEKHRQREDEFPTYYSKQCFNFWRKKEIKMFKADYCLVLEDNVETPRNLQAIVSKAVVVPGRRPRSSMRPICPYTRKMLNWSVYNEARELNAVLDYHLRTNHSGYPPLKGLKHVFRDIRSYLKLFPKEKELFFIKTDVTKAFANINQRLLRECLEEVVGTSSCVTLNREVNDKEKLHLKGYSMVASGETENSANECLTRLVRKRKKMFVDTPDRAICNKWTNIHFRNRFMKMMSRLRFRINSKHKRLYRMRKGVPQGFFMSSRLSHIYLSSFDRQLAQFNVKRFRYVDDYLFVTQTKEDAINLLDFLQRPNNGYGIEFRRAKTETSFACDYVEKPTPNMIWCAARLDTKQKKLTRNVATSLVMHRKKVNGLHFTERSLLRKKWKQKENRLYKLYNGDDIT